MEEEKEKSKEAVEQLKEEEIEEENNQTFIKENKSKKKRIILILIIMIAIIASVVFCIIGLTTLEDYQKETTNDEVNRRSSSDIETLEFKPIIYLYPTENTEVLVTLGNPDKVTVSYPKYMTGWKVLAESDGTLTDLVTGKSLYSLYYESINSYDFEVTNEGFIVKGEDITEFLEEKLAILGLTEREAEEFIIYWLPILQENEYNYIRFATLEEIEENMPLEIDPNPDTLIRVLMTYKGLSEPIEVEEQELITPERTGFVAVEWGGTKIE